MDAINRPIFDQTRQQPYGDSWRTLEDTVSHPLALPHHCREYGYQFEPSLPDTCDRPATLEIQSGRNGSHAVYVSGTALLCLRGVLANTTLLRSRNLSPSATAR